MKLMAFVVLCVLGIWLNCARAAGDDENFCGPLDNAFGPFDYINPAHRAANYGRNLSMVERFHFTRDVETLRRGNTSVHPGDDIDYTLRAWPNHHRALVSMGSLVKRHFPKRAPGLEMTADCYFDRAIRMSPNDAMAYALYATFHAWMKRKQLTIASAERAYEIGPDNKNVNYSIGVAYADIGENDKALFHARKAAELGHNATGLKNRLRKLGVWK